MTVLNEQDSDVGRDTYLLAIKTRYTILPHSHTAHRNFCRNEMQTSVCLHQRRWPSVSLAIMLWKLSSRRNH